MTIHSDKSSFERTNVALHAEFLAMMPSIQRTARCAFRSLSPEAKEEAIAETVARVFVAYQRLVQTGKRQVAYPVRLAKYSISQIRSGRRVGTAMNSRDMMSLAAQRQHGFTREPWPLSESQTVEWNEALLDNSSTPVPDQAAFRCDFPEWLAMQPHRDRRVAEALAVGFTTGETANEFGLSTARISQLRREFENSWQEFHADTNEDFSSNQHVDRRCRSQ